MDLLAAGRCHGQGKRSLELDRFVDTGGSAHQCAASCPPAIVDSGPWQARNLSQPSRRYVCRSRHEAGHLPEMTKNGLGQGVRLGPFRNLT